jgi:hypothetical protein
MAARPDLAQRNRDRARHSMTKTATYKSWHAMKYRCLVETSKDFPRYGGRGITVCERWMLFDNFYADMGDRPAGSSLERIDNELGYSPENCRWASPVDQARNRRSTKKHEFCGALRSIAEISELCGVQRKTLEYRIRSGWSLNDATTRESNHGNGWSIKRKNDGNQSRIAA